MTLTAVDGARLDFTEPAVAHEALSFQAADIARAIGGYRTEVAARPLADTIATLAVLDEMRRQLLIESMRSVPPADGHLRKPRGS